VFSGTVMGQVLVRNLADEVIETHRARAKARGISLEQELREVLGSRGTTYQRRAARRNGPMPETNAG
jgi:plasmid stability protein